MRRWALGFAVVLSSAPAQAFVCTRVSDRPSQDPVCPPVLDPDPDGPSLSWFTRSIPFSVSAAGTSDIPANDEAGVLQAAFTPWSSAQECRPSARHTDLTFVPQTPSTRDFVGFNFLDEGTNENLLIFQDAGWPHDNSQVIIALTTTTFNPLTGELFDADIEFNSANNTFTVDDGAPQTDLMNTAVHEIGHFLGLAHVPVVGAPQDCLETMCRSAIAGEINKRDLECDDKNAIVFKYPAAQSDGYCTPLTTDCGCCAAPDLLTSTPVVTVTDTDDGTGCAAAPSGLAAVAILLGLRGRRRRRAP